MFIASGTINASKVVAPFSLKLAYFSLFLTSHFNFFIVIKKIYIYNMKFAILTILSVQFRGVK